MLQFTIRKAVTWWEEITCRQTSHRQNDQSNLEHWEWIQSKTEDHVGSIGVSTGANQLLQDIDGHVIINWDHAITTMSTITQSCSSSYGDSCSNPEPWRTHKFAVLLGSVPGRNLRQSEVLQRRFDGKSNHCCRSDSIVSFWIATRTCCRSRDEIAI